MDATFESPWLSFYRQKDIEELLDDPEFDVMPINWSCHNSPQDGQAIPFPQSYTPHFKVAIEGYLITSIGLIIKKKQSS